MAFEMRVIKGKLHTLRIQTDKESVLLKESPHTSDCLQIEEDIKSQETTHPLAVRGIIKDIFHIQLTEGTRNSETELRDHC